MPYKIVEENNKWFVENIDTGEKRPKDGYATKAEAVDYLKALEANVPDANKAISKREDVSQADKERAVSEYGNVNYADEKNKKYPIDTEEHIRAAWNYINKEANAGKYDPSEVATIKRKIIAAWKDKIDKAGPPSAEEKSVKIGATFNKDNREHLSEIKKSAKAMADHLSKMADHASNIMDRTDQMMPDPAAESEAASYPAESGEGNKSSDFLVAYGGEVKATQLNDGNVKLGGYLIRFGDPDNTDLVGDFFTKNTDFGDATNSDSWFNHRIPVTYNGRSVVYKNKLPKAALTKDDVGIFAEIVLGARNDYEKTMGEMGMAGKLGWSSGTASHLVERKQHPNGANEILSWPVGLDASLTPTPMEPYNQIVPLKSLSEYMTAKSTTTGEAEATKMAQSTDVMDAATNSTIPVKGENNMTETVAISKEELQALVKDAAAEGVKAYQKAQPAPDTSGVAVVKDEADRPFQSLAEQALAVKMSAMTHGVKTDPRLNRLVKQEMEAIKGATGANESVPADAGYLIEPTLSKELLVPLHEEGPFSSKVRKLPVGSNSNFGYLNGIDETSRKTGSRWGGVEGYRLAEAGTLTTSRPKFRRINWELKKFAVLMYATDELILDAAQFSAVANQSAAEELAFMVNDDILNGLGTGGPLGILKSGALIGVTRDTASHVYHADILNMWQRMLPRYRGGAEWFVHSTVEPELDALYFTGTTSVLSPYVSYSQDGVMKIMGKPVNVTEFNPALNSAGDILLANLGEYLFWEKADIQAATSIHIAFLTDEQAFRWIFRCDGQTAHYSPITPYQGSTTQSAFVCLNAASA